MKCYLFWVIAALLLKPYNAISAEVVTYIKPDGIKAHSHEYFIRLLALAFEKTNNDFNQIELKPTAEMQQGRAIHQLILGRHVDVIWTVTSIEREKYVLPIRIPLLKGLLGHRVLVIRKTDKEEFSKISKLDDLRKYIAGQGHDWPDTEILRANQMKVTTSSTFESLYAMLSAGRFDYFPRGVNEAVQELKLQNNPELIIDDNVLLYYPSPIYFFVNSDRQLLANRIEEGLTLAIEDGSFERLFTQYYAGVGGLDILSLNQRQLIKLENPILPAFTPLSNEMLWHKIDER